VQRGWSFIEPKRKALRRDTHARRALFTSTLSIYCWWIVIHLYYLSRFCRL